MAEIYDGFRRVILSGDNTTFACIDETVAESAAKLRADQHVTLSDALQIATAVTNGCDGFVTHDLRLKKVKEIPMIVIQELKASS